VSSGQLQQAAGKVRCGRCSHVFNALSEIEEQFSDDIEPSWLQTSDESTGAAQPDAEELLDEQNSPDESDPTEDVEFEATNVFEENLIRNLDGLDDEVAETTGEFTDEELLHSDAIVLIDDDAITVVKGPGEVTAESDNIDGYSTEAIPAADEDQPDEDTLPENLSTTDSPDDWLPEDRSGNEPYIGSDTEDGSEAEPEYEPEEEPEYAEDPEDFLVEDEPEEHESDNEPGEDLEFNVPKNQWSSFFSGRYDGPIIDPVGPLDGSEPAATDPIDIGDAEGEPETGDDEPWEDFDEIIEGNANDEQDDDQPSDDDGMLADTDVYESFDSVDTPEDPDSNSDDKLRTAIDTLTMHQAEWQRLIDTTEDEADPDEPAAATPTDIAEDDETSDSDNDPAETKQPQDFEEHDFEDQAQAADDALISEEEPDDSPEPGHGEYHEADDDHETLEPDPEEHSTEEPEEVTPIWVSDHDDQPVKSSGKKGLVAAILLLLAAGLGAQLVHHNRETLATHPQYGDKVRKVYDLINKPLFPAWDLEAYEFRGSEAISGESGAGILDIRAQLAVTGKQAMGEPLIKIVLKDRWGKEVSSRVFTPDEYSQGMRPPNGLVNPGALIPVTISVADPGSDAQGFELRICLPHESGVPQCKS